MELILLTRNDLQRRDKSKEWLQELDAFKNNRSNDFVSQGVRVENCRSSLSSMDTAIDALQKARFLLDNDVTASTYLTEVYNQLQISRKMINEVMTDQKQEWSEKLLGRECVCVRSDRQIKDHVYDACFWEGIIMKPEQDLGVTQPYVVHFRRSRRGTMDSKNHRCGQMIDINVKAPASLDDVTYWMICREETRLLWNKGLKRSGRPSYLTHAAQELDTPKKQKK